MQSHPVSLEDVARRREQQSQGKQARRLAEILTCERCGKTFVREKQKHRRFCSHECLVAAAREVSKGRVYRRPRGARPVTKEEFDRILARQGGTCALCRRPQKSGLFVDHDHLTGEIRGLLCAGCNSGLGHLGDTAESLYRAYRYLAEAEALVAQEA